jgi:hypothetical protein
VLGQRHADLVPIRILEGLPLMLANQNSAFQTNLSKYGLLATQEQIPAFLSRYKAKTSPISVGGGSPSAATKTPRAPYGVNA